MDTSKMIKAYCLKTKEKNVPMQDAVITKTAKGGYMAGGHDGKGNKMATFTHWSFRQMCRMAGAPADY